MKIGNLAYIIYGFTNWFFQQNESDQPAIVGGILEPDPVPFSFETIGWKILGGILLLVLLIISYKRFKLYQKNRYRRQAIAKIQKITAEKSQSGQKIRHFNIVLKQVAIEAFGRVPVAELYGNEWLMFLDSKVRNSSFTDFGNSFTDAMYSDKEIEEKQLNAIYKLTKTWIHEHS